MCGICGTSGAGDGAGLRRMNQAMRHRGPDEAGIHIDPDTGVGIGATRLSIMDPARGHQPMVSACSGTVAVLNGEIYNQDQLRQRLRAAGHPFTTTCDTEVLPHLYEHDGDDMVQALEGMYALAIWDPRRQRLLLARDRFGEKPLYYSAGGGQLHFASEMRALRAATGAPAEILAAGVDAFFVFGYLPPNERLLAGIEELAPGHVLTWDAAAGVTVSRYWAPLRHPAPRAVNLVETVAETEALLTDAVRTRLMADVPLGVMLSGGVDSTLITALAVRQRTGPLATFTVGYADQPEVDETDAARRVAELLGTEHHELILSDAMVATVTETLLDRLDVPIADTALVALSALSDYARNHVTVLLGGEGADEVFGGYPRYWHLPRIAAAHERAGAVMKAAPTAALGGRWRRVLERALLVERQIGWVAGGRERLRTTLYGERMRSVAGVEVGSMLTGPVGRQGTTDWLMLLDQQHWLPGDVLVKADRASMYSSLETRAPYLERMLVEFAASIPVDVHIRDGGKYLTRQVADRLLPERPRGGKRAFGVPIGAWLRGPLASLVERHLEGSSLYADGWMRRQPVVEVWRRHRSGGSDESPVLWPLLCIGQWMDNLERLA